MKESTKLLSAAVAVTMSFGTFAAIRSITPTAWNGDTNCWQMARHNQKMEEVKKGGAKVVFIGDSITHFWEGAGNAQYKRYMSEGDYKMLDLGTSADRTEHVLWRLQNGELDGYEAKCIFLMIGTNNTGHFDFSKEPPIDTILGIREVLRTIRKKQPNAIIVLSPIFPRGRDKNDGYRIRNEIVNKEIRKFTDGEKIFWCDFNDQFLTPDGLLSPEVFPDRLHPSAIGYEIWFAAVKPYIDYALADGKLPRPANRYASYFRAENVHMDEPWSLYPNARISGDMVGWDWWLERMKEKRNQIVDAKGNIDVVLMGDSITHFWESKGKAQLATLTNTYSVLDIGYSGDQTQHLLWRIKNGELDGYKAKCLVLMIGTNNSGASAEEVANGIKEVLKVAAAKQPQAKIVLLPIFPDGPDAKYQHRVKNMKTNEIIKWYADGKKIVWVDFNNKLIDEKGDTLPFMDDRLHPNSKGYDIWLEAIQPYLKEACSK